MMRRVLWTAVAAVTLTAGTLLTLPLMYSGGSTSVWAQTTPAEGKPTETIRPEAVAPAQELSRAFRSVHHAVKDAVVNINTQRKMTAAARNQIPEELRKMLPPDFRIPEEPRGGDDERLRPFGTGSGVLISADGYIVTNNHVVEDADTITVKLADGRELKAKIIGTDPKTDLALIKIEDGTKLTFAKFGNSDVMEVGDWVLAFGSPFGFDQTMTQGIVSAKGRQINIIGMHNPALMGLTYENFIQTDAAINPGNSGGPLMNLKGEIVGINTAIASRTGAYNGIGFSIPSNDVQYIVKSLRETGKVVRGYMGVGIADVRDAQVRVEARALGYQGNTGVIVKEVRDDSPGGKGGLQLNDIITQINGQPVETINQLRNEVARTAPGTKITLQVYRDGKQVEVSFPVGTQPDTALSSAGGRDGARPQPAAKLPDLFNDLGVGLTEDAGKGLLVTQVDPNGLGAEFGLAKGDVIFKAHNQPVKTIAELRAALEKAKDQPGVFLSVRKPDGAEQSIYVRRERK